MSLSAIAIQQAAAILAERRHSGQQGPCLPLTCRPQDEGDALSIQQAVLGVLQDQPGAWKCGLPTAAGVVMAPIHARTVFRAQDQVALVWARGGQVRVEPELAFVMGRALPPRGEPYSLAEVEEAIERVHLALELIDSRYAPDADPGDGGAVEPGFIDKLADGLVNQGLWLGPSVSKAEGIAAARLAIDIGAHGVCLGQWAGQHPNAQPVAPLHWLVNALSRQGRGLAAHEVVITGSYAGAIGVPLGQDITVQFGALGTLHAHFQSRRTSR